MRSRRTEEEKPSAPHWMTTYADMVTLLLTFFVLLFAMSEVDTQKFKSIISSFQGSLGVLESGRDVVEADGISNSFEGLEDNMNSMEVENFKKLREELNEYLQQTARQGQILVESDHKGLILRFNDNVLFDSGRADIKIEGEESLNFIGDMLKQQEFKDKSIRVEGHTDSDPMVMSEKFPTNWELSVTRASNVVRFFIERVSINPDRLSAAGYGQYKPISSNKTEEEKQKNRRVDIVILKEE